MSAKPTEDEVIRFADMFSAMGTGPRLRIMRVLLSAYPDGMVVGDIGSAWASRHPRFHTIWKSSGTKAW